MIKRDLKRSYWQISIDPINYNLFSLFGNTVLKSAQVLV